MAAEIAVAAGEDREEYVATAKLLKKNICEKYKKETSLTGGMNGKTAVLS